MVTAILYAVGTGLVAILVAAIRMGLKSAILALGVASKTITVANKATDKAVDASKRVAKRGTANLARGGQRANGALAKAHKSKVLKTGGNMAIKGTKKVADKGADAAGAVVKGAKKVAATGAKLAIKGLQALLRWVDGILAALCAASTIVMVIAVVVATAALTLLASFSATTVLISKDGFKSTSTIQGSQGTSGDSSKTKAVSNGDGWSKKGQVSVTHYIQDDDVAGAEKVCTNHGKHKEYWSMAYNNGGTVHGAGCGALALTNAVSGCTGKAVEPADIVDICNANGGTVNCGLACAKAVASKYDLELVTLGWWATETGNKVTEEPSGNFPGMKKIRQMLDDKYVCVMSVDWGNGMVRAGHYICVYGYDDKGYYVSDSWFLGDSESFVNKRGESRTGMCYYTLDEPYTADEVFNCGIQGLFFLKKK